MAQMTWLLHVHNIGYDGSYLWSYEGNLGGFCSLWVRVGGMLMEISLLSFLLDPHICGEPEHSPFGAGCN